MEFDWIFRCPHCEGRIARWVVRENLSCPSCHAKLKSNVRAAARRSVFVGLSAGFITWLVIWFITVMWVVPLFTSSNEAGLFLGLEVGAFLGLIVGNVFFRYAISISVAKGPENAL